MANWHIFCLTMFYFSQKVLKTQGIYLQNKSPLAITNTNKVISKTAKDSINFVTEYDNQKVNNLSSLVKMRNKPELEQGRGKYYGYKKLSKMVYPLMLGVFVAKTFLVPLMLKLLTLLSSSALIMSKLALVASIFVTLKWLMEPTTNTENTETSRVDFIYLPPSRSSLPLQRLTSGNVMVGDMVGSGSTNIPGRSSSKYIPVTIQETSAFPKNNRPVQRPFSDTGFRTIYNDQTFL